MPQLGALPTEDSLDGDSLDSSYVYLIVCVKVATDAGGNATGTERGPGNALREDRDKGGSEPAPPPLLATP